MINAKIKNSITKLIEINKLLELCHEHLLKKC